MSGFYDLTDKAIDILNRRAVKRFEDAKDEAALAKFDELNVLEVTEHCIKTSPMIIRKSFLNWRKSGIRRPNRTERNHLI